MLKGKGLAIMIVILLLITNFLPSATAQTIDVSAHSAILMDEELAESFMMYMLMKKVRLLVLQK